MMTAVNEIFGFLGKLVKWWFIVMPWEQAIFIRSGKKTKLLGPGLYFKIPFLDLVFLQTIRTRMVDIPFQTITTKDFKTLTIKTTIGYSISDMFKLYNTLAQPEFYLASLTSSHVSDFIVKSNFVEISPLTLENYVNSKMNAEQYGLQDFKMHLTGWAEVRTYRIIQDSSYVYNSLNMGHIDFVEKNNQPA